MSVSMSQDEYEKKLWILNVLGGIQDKTEKTANCEEIKDIITENGTYHTHNEISTDEVEEILNHLEKLGLVRKYNSEKWILDTVGLDEWH